MVASALSRVAFDIQTRRNDFIELDLCPDLVERMAFESDEYEGLANAFRVAEVVYCAAKAEPKDATPELLAIAEAFKVLAPDADGDVWLVIKEAGVGVDGAVNLGKPDRIVAQVATLLEKSRRAAVAKARGKA